LCFLNGTALQCAAMRSGCRFRNAASLFLFALAAITPSTLYADKLQQQLKDQYEGKLLLLRNFYDGSSLHYDADGHIQGVWMSGDWTVDGIVRIEDIRLASHLLTIQGRRLHMGWVTGGFSDVPDAKPANSQQVETRELRIEADLRDGPVADSANAMLAMIFLTPEDRFADLVPDYWKPCVLVALTGGGVKLEVNCRFSPEFTAIPGVAARPGEAAENDNPQGVFRQIGHGVTPPKVLLQGEPQFSDEARRAKYEGTDVVSLVVDQTGQAKDIRIVSPLGMGLDRKAVESISKWQFDPGEKDGKPVAVQIEVEVDFHLN